MKTAKDWAADVVPAPERRLSWEWTAAIRDGLDGVALGAPSGKRYMEEQVDVARAIIERLVECAQDDMLDNLVTYLKEQDRSLDDGERLDLDYCIARFRDRLLPKIEEALR